MKKILLLLPNSSITNGTIAKLNAGGASIPMQVKIIPHQQILITAICVLKEMVNTLIYSRKIFGNSGRQ